MFSFLHFNFISSEGIVIAVSYTHLPEIFYFAMSATQSELHTSLMIGDNWKNDVEGAKNVGMGNVYYNIKGEKSLPFKPGFDMRDWREIASFL